MLFVSSIFLQFRVNFMKICLFIMGTILLFPFITDSKVDAASNPNLFVSAENPLFNNHFDGAMVIEVIIKDPLISDTDEGKGEPDVSLNGSDLRMVQATDGSWYAYFANKEKAQIADGISFNNGAGAAGQGLDFGLFCGSNTDGSVLGISISDSVGVAVPRTGLGGATNGETTLGACTGTILSGPSINNVVKNPKTINTNTGNSGQIGLDPNAWPLIQLFSFSDEVSIKYNRAGGTQEVVLHYDDIPNISLNLDRTGYPLGAEVIITLNDIQLNQDPTNEDSWTFNVDSPIATFYQAFDENGGNAANGGAGLIDLIPHLSSLGFVDNGALSLDLGPIIRLKSNDNQPTLTVTDGSKTYSKIITLVESTPNSGIFESYDTSNESVVAIKNDAPRGQSATIEYNDEKTSILSGLATGTIDLNGGSPVSGKSIPVTIVDNDQNFDSKRRDILDVFSSLAIIPTLQMGNPITLEKASSVQFYPSSGSDLVTGGTLAPSSVPDNNSDRLIIDSGPSAFPFNFDFEMISIDLGVTADDLQNLFIDINSPNSIGTNWINFDLRSFQQQLNLNDFSKTTMTLNFGLADPTPITIIDVGDITSPQALVQIDDADITAINLKSGDVFLVINFDSLNSGIKGTISSEKDTQPIMFDLFSFGQIGNQEINNAIYRFELEETSANSGTFGGTMEYAITNQVNINDPQLISSLRTIDDDIKFLVSDRLLDEKGITISYSDISQTGSNIPTSSKSDIPTHSGTVGFGSTSYRFGQPVIVQLFDPDLNLDSNQIDIYNVIDNPASPNVDTIGDSSGVILVEIKIKDIRYKRCSINGIEYGGLASTGISLVETKPNSGIFQGSFKMPSQICDKTGTKLISTAGGSLDAVYHDFRDQFGEPNIFTTGRQNSQLFTTQTSPTLNFDKFVIPKPGQTTDVILNGNIQNYKTGTPIKITISEPDGDIRNLVVYATNQGNYRMVSTLTPNTESGKYTINIQYQKSINTVTFDVVKNEVPSWIKNNAHWWAANQISDSDFVKGIEHLIKEKIIDIPDSVKSEKNGQNIPTWIKKTAEWWASDIVSDDEFMSTLEFLVKNGIIRI
jgi:hypothetical protein